jgi:putative redox protein
VTHTTDLTDSAADDVEGDERIQPISVRTEYLGRYQSANHIRDLDPMYIDEPTDLGGRNSGPTALESTLAALNSCTAMIMYVLKREMRFDLGDLRFEADGWIDVRRIEMKKTGKLYSQVEPVADHYQRVVQRVFITTSETGERLEHFKNEVHRLCPMHALLRDAGVPLESDWRVTAP